MSDSGGAPVDAALGSGREHVELLVAVIEGEKYALEVGRVGQIRDDVIVTPVPRSPPTVRGVASVDGDVTVVADAAAVVTGEAGDATDAAEVVLLDREEDVRAVGVVVDEVLGIDPYHVDRIRPPDAAEDPFRALLDSDDEDPIPVLDVPRLIADVTVR